MYFRPGVPTTSGMTSFSPAAPSAYSHMHMSQLPSYGASCYQSSDLSHYGDMRLGLRLSRKFTILFGLEVVIHMFSDAAFCIFAVVLISKLVSGHDRHVNYHLYFGLTIPSLAKLSINKLITQPLI